MRLVQVSPYCWDSPGGVQIHIRQLSEHLRARGHEVLILAPGKHVHDREGVRIVGRSVGVRWNGSVVRGCLSRRSSQRVRKALETFRPDVIHVHEPFTPGAGMFAVRYANAPVVATFHSYYDPGRFHSRVYSAAGPLLKRIWQKVQQRIAVSEAALGTVISRMGDGAVRILPNGTDVDVFATAAPAALPAGRRLLFVGRLEPRKGFPVAVDAFARLAADYPDLRLVVVGEGDDRHAFDALPDGVRARVDMVGRVSGAALPGYYRAADIFLAPSMGSESFGIILAEAMAAGRPVVASDIPGYRAVTRHEQEGLLVPPGNAAALARAIRRLLDDPALARSLGDRGHIRARAFDWSTIVHELETIYRNLAQRGLRPVTTRR